jgi:mannan endo-1,4-beta-mannosidase
MALGVALLGCGNVSLQTTFLAEQNSENTNSNAPLSPTFFVLGRSLFDPCRQPVILRGINEMITFSDGKDGIPEYSEIAKTHANSVRIYWRTSDTANELDVALTNSEQQKLIPIVYVFNYLITNPNIVTTVSMAADYWTRSDVLSVVNKHQHWLIIALRERNVPYSGTPADTAAWAANYDSAVKRLRLAGINVPLAIDAPNSGSDIDTLRMLGLARIAADSIHNLLLSVNAWWSTMPDIRNEFTLAQQAALPLMVGEVSGYAQPGCPNTQFDYSTLMAAAQDTGTGWLAWSWGGVKNFDCPGGFLDMTTDGTYAGLVGWGYNVAVGDTNSIQNTAAPSVYTPGSVCPVAN